MKILSTIWNYKGKIRGLGYPESMDEFTKLENEVLPVILEIEEINIHFTEHFKF